MATDTRTDMYYIILLQFLDGQKRQRSEDKWQKDKQM